MDNRVYKKHFTSNSIFDYTNKGLGDCPKKQRGNQTKMVQCRVINENLYYVQQVMLCGVSGFIKF